MASDLSGGPTEYEGIVRHSEGTTSTFYDSVCKSTSDDPSFYEDVDEFSLKHNESKDRQKYFTYPSTKAPTRKKNDSILQKTKKMLNTEKISNVVGKKCTTLQKCFGIIKHKGKEKPQSVSECLSSKPDTVTNTYQTDVTRPKLPQRNQKTYVKLPANESTLSSPSHYMSMTYKPNEEKTAVYQNSIPESGLQSEQCNELAVDKDDHTDSDDGTYLRPEPRQKGLYKQYLLENLSFEMFQYIEHTVFTLVLAVLISIYYKKGPQQFFRVIVLALKELPGVKVVIDLVLKNEVSSFVKTTSLAQDVITSKPRVVIPDEGLRAEEMREMMKNLQRRDANPERDGNVFAYQYTLCDDNYKLQQEAFDSFCEKTGHSVEHEALVKEFFHGFMHENALNPMIFPALRLMETEVVSMTAAMLNGNSEVVGFLTSGGTESNLMAVKTFRDMALATRTNIRKPNIVAPITIHPTIDKAAHYFGLEVIHTPMAADFRADVKAMEKAINSDTVMLCASAPQFCHGVMDPIEEIAALALKKGLPLHVDACFGGFMLPWVEKLGYPMPKFDFRIPGVTSMSADVHKYGFCVKGASVICYRNSDIRKYQIYAYSEWPGGLYGSPSMAGTRPGGNIAAAWAAMKALGKNGYMDKAKVLMDTTIKMITRIKSIQGIYIMGEPCMTAFAIAARDPNINIQAVADVMETKGWKMERNQLPDSLHCSILPHHIPVADKFLDDLEDSTNYCRDNKALAKKGTAGVYGMMANIPDKGIVTDFLIEFFSEVYKCK